MPRLHIIARSFNLTQQATILVVWDLQQTVVWKCALCCLALTLKASLSVTYSFSTATFLTNPCSVQCILGRLLATLPFSLHGVEKLPCFSQKLLFLYSVSRINHVITRCMVALFRKCCGRETVPVDKPHVAVSTEVIFATAVMAISYHSKGQIIIFFLQEGKGQLECS